MCIASSKARAEIMKTDRPEHYKSELRAQIKETIDDALYFEEKGKTMRLREKYLRELLESLITS